MSLLKIEEFDGAKERFGPLGEEAQDRNKAYQPTTKGDFYSKLYAPKKQASQFLQSPSLALLNSIGS
jgi:hypothetical protein